MRSLTNEELEWVVGGLATTGQKNLTRIRKEVGHLHARPLTNTVSTVTVVAPPDPLPVPVGDPGPGTITGGTGGGSGATAPPSGSQQTSQQAAAAKYAAGHIQTQSGFDLNNALDNQVYTLEYNNLYNLYLKAEQAGSGTTIAEPNGVAVSGTTLLNQLANYNIVLEVTPADQDPSAQRSNGAYSPAYTAPTSINTQGQWTGATTVVHVNDLAGPGSQYLSDLGSVAAVVNYEEFHEFGHYLGNAQQYEASQGYVASTTGSPSPMSQTESENVEKYANSEGLDLAMFAGVSYPNGSQLVKYFGGTYHVNQHP